jgi:hypothetical protein
MRGVEPNFLKGRERLFREFWIRIFWSLEGVRCWLELWVLHSDFGVWNVRELPGIFTLKDVGLTRNFYGKNVKFILFENARALPGIF